MLLEKNKQMHYPNVKYKKKIYIRYKNIFLCIYVHTQTHIDTDTYRHIYIYIKIGYGNATRYPNITLRAHHYTYDIVP